LEKHAPRVLFGRETELAALDAAWAKGTLNVYTLVAWGGAGKTSLVFHWVQEQFAKKVWPGVERYFDWSFYSQGTGESRQTSADLFIHKALEFFGDPDPTRGGPHERGERLARLVRQHRSLLILDGIEPLQYPPNDPQAGRLKDPALETLLRELAADNPGLVVITTREHLTNVEGHATTEERKLDKLPREAAVALLRDHLKIVGTDEELHAAWRDAGGHALTLSLLGRYIADACEDRDIRHYREVKFEAADQEHQGRSAFKVMIAYERWLRSGGLERQRELAVLRLTGLFDRPMAKSCLQALRAEPSIPGLTDVLVTLTPQQWNIAVKRLSEVDLLSATWLGHPAPVSAAGSRSYESDAIDAHPLIREYFALQLQREQPEAFRGAHSRLFDYLCETTKPHRPDGLDGLAPLYEAVTHGCLAGRHQDACDKVYFDRILRGAGSDGFYSSRKLGAIGADLAAVAAFFVPSSVAWASRPCDPFTGETPGPLSELPTGGTPVLRPGPWSQVSPNLTAADQAWLLNAAALRLRALGRLTEALQPMRAGLEMRVQQKNWKQAAISASNLSELEVTLGRLPDAVTDARQSITHADQSGDAFQRMSKRTTAADALHQSGQRAESGALFAEAEQMQQEMQPQFDLLYSVRGFRYCDWLLAPAEQAAWQMLRGTGVPPVLPDAEPGTGVPPVESEHGRDAHATGGFRIRQGANLPHWRQDGAIYAVTFRLADSVPRQILEGWRIEREELVQAAIRKSGQLSPAEADRLKVLFSEKVETFLNQRQGACWMMRDDVAGLVQNALLHFDGSRYDLFAWCVMPNHVHVVVQPRPEHSLESILHSWKSFTSRKIGQIVGRMGTIWQAEYYDHLVRDEDDLFHAMEYVLNNPQAAGLENWRWVGHRRGTGVPPVEGTHGRDAHATVLADIERRATTTLAWGTPQNWLLDIALDHLTLARVGLIRAILEAGPKSGPGMREGEAPAEPQIRGVHGSAGASPSRNPTASNPSDRLEAYPTNPTLDLPHVADAVKGLRAAGQMNHLPRGLLTAALYHFVRGEPALAEKHLAEAWQIAERGPMPLFLADIHLTRARLFHDRDELAKAATLIRELGYGRRNEELANAEKALA